MSCAMSMPPPWYWGGMGNNQPQGPMMPDLNSIRAWMKELKSWEDELKPKKDEKKKEPPFNVLGIMAFMLLISPITGPTMFHFFQQSLSLIK